MLIILVFACIGCPQQYARRTLVLTGVTGAGETSAAEPTNAPEVQTAVRIITAALARHSITPTVDTNLTIAGALVSYAQFSPEGQPVIGRYAWVSVKDRALIFTIAEHAHLSAGTKSIIKVIKRELKDRYGASRVKTRL
jgi:hypothetical protein